MKKATLHPLLRAVIDTLPKSDSAWPDDRRQAFLRMLATAFDVVYGPTERPADPPLLTATDGLGKPVLLRAVATDRWHIDAEGQARTPQGHEASLESVPHGTLFLDMRTTTDQGRADTIIWKDGTWPAKAVTSKGILFKAHEKDAA